MDHAMVKWFGEFFKSELQTGAIKADQALVNAYPVVSDIVGIVVVGALILVAIVLFVGLRKKKTA
jgi:hypothetical protein